MSKLDKWHIVLFLISELFIYSHVINAAAVQGFSKRQSSEERCGRKVVAYYTSFGEREMTKEMLNFVTHVIYAFPSMSSNGSLGFGSANSSRFHKLLKLRGNSPHPKIMIAIGGADSGDQFQGMVRKEEAFNLFVTKLKTILTTYNLDGVDIDWEFPGTYPDDKALHVIFMRSIRDFLDTWSAELGRPRYILTFAGPPGYAIKGFDLKRLFATDAIDWVNVMTYDYFGPWPNSTAGRNAGPPAPLFFYGPPGYASLNVHWTMEQYACAIKDPSKLVMGIPLYGRLWHHVDGEPDGDPVWRKMNRDILQANDIRWYQTIDYHNRGYKPAYNDKIQGAYAYNEVNKTYIGFESPESALVKVEYAVKAGIGGVMMWAIDYDDDNNTMLQAISRTDICASASSITNLTVPEYRCYEPRWWVWTKETENKFGLCGVTAPLVNGRYPVCDSLDSLHACCGAEGRCGAGKEFCECPNCVDYGKHPEKIVENSLPPSLKTVLWFTSEDKKYFGKCGPYVPRINGTVAICNPDNPNAHCCSEEGVCGTGKEHCDCPGCVDFKVNPRMLVKTLEKRKWWTWENGSKNVGRCGAFAPRIDGEVAICDPNSQAGYCCGSFGYCGSGEKFCDCEGCTDYRIM